jgi:hypothetical protein
MTLGLLDLPTPLLAWLDQALAGLLPPAGRIVVWGLVAAAVSMGLYAILSPQHRLRAVRERAAEARRALDRYEGSFAGARPLMGAMFATSLQQLALVLVPAVVASLPVLFLLVWLHGAFAYEVPAHAEAVDLRIEPQGYEATVEKSDAAVSVVPEIEAPPSLVVHDGTGRVIEERALTVPVTSLHKEQWWNALIGNPLGYLPEDSPLEWIELDLPRKEVLPVGPWWLRTWEFVFFTTLVAASLVIKLWFRLV